MRYTFIYLCCAWCLSPVSNVLFAQAPSWQQRVSYTMHLRLDTALHTLQGKQQLIYHNNSPDTLRRVYYHLYFNAFQPGSMMDVRSRTIPDPDRRVQDRILTLSQNERGHQYIQTLTQDKQACNYRTVGTLLVVELPRPLPPSQSTQLDMTFETHIPKQIRRTGRNNAEGIAYSMSQWYPKMAEYDHRGWHPTPYVGREFHGVWGDFDVTIEIAAQFVVAATGTLQPPDTISTPPSLAAAIPAKEGHRRWHFIAKQVHDFVWAADTHYLKDSVQVKNGPILQLYYTKDVHKVWQKMKPLAAKAFSFFSQHYGKYPYPSYSIVQGGDGGMEYPMATLVTGNRTLRSLVDVVVHEIAHSWYQGLLATNESRYAWMDEGFTTYVAHMAMQHLFPEEENSIVGEYRSYKRLVDAGKEEPMRTLADHFQTNYAYGVAAYAKGAIFQHQLAYIIGQKAFDRGLLRYFHTWKYRHPEPIDYIRIMEQGADMKLDWYYTYFVETTHHIDYAIQDVKAENSGTRLLLTRIGTMPMPIELLVTLNDDSKQLYYIPLRIMWGKKAKEGNNPRYITQAWPWTHPHYRLDIPVPFEDIKAIAIDPSGRLADLDKNNNSYPSQGENSTAPTDPPDKTQVMVGKIIVQD